MKIPFVNLKQQYNNIKSDIDNAIADVIQETSFIGGKHVNEFERKFAEIYGVKHVISCANGTDSLYIIMKMLGIGIGDEVITAANSWISSSETITQTGARPVFLDVHPEYYSMDETLLLSKITKNTKAVMAVHLQGQMCAIDAIKKICAERGIYLIEDCAQSHFSSFEGVKAGLFGIAASFSFYPGKNLGAYGDAGCIITNDDQLAEKCRMYANHGALKKHHHVIEGINSRLDGLQAAILNAKIPYILDWTSKRIEKAELYRNYLSGIESLILPKQRENTLHSYHLFVVRAKKRDDLAEWLKSKDIEVAIHYPTALPNLPAYQYLKSENEAYPIATQLQSEILSLPIYPELTEQEIEYVAKAIKDFYSNEA